MKAVRTNTKRWVLNVDLEAVSRRRLADQLERIAARLRLKDAEWDDPVEYRSASVTTKRAFGAWHLYDHVTEKLSALREQESRSRKVDMDVVCTRRMSAPSLRAVKCLSVVALTYAALAFIAWGVL